MLIILQLYALPKTCTFISILIEYLTNIITKVDLMNLDFDPRKNITKLDYFIMKLKRLNDLARDKENSKELYDVLLFRIGLKNVFLMQLHNSQIKMCLFVFFKYLINTFDIITNLD